MLNNLHSPQTQGTVTYQVINNRFCLMFPITVAVSTGKLYSPPSKRLNTVMPRRPKRNTQFKTYLIAINVNFQKGSIVNLILAITRTSTQNCRNPNFIMLLQKRKCIIRVSQNPSPKFKPYSSPSFVPMQKTHTCMWVFSIIEVSNLSFIRGNLKVAEK